MRKGMSSEREGYSRKILVFRDLHTIKTRKIIWFFYEVAIKYLAM